jgi:hypothetical protein
MAEENRFLNRLATGMPLVIAEGYIFELERRGYLSAGPYWYIQNFYQINHQP